MTMNTTGVNPDEIFDYIDGKKKWLAETGKFIDERDGKTYKTVKMPDGRVWMAENLNFETESGSWCYDDDPSNAAKYGRLYDWETAKAVCPKGWHLPSREEWDELCRASGGEEMGQAHDNAGNSIPLDEHSGWNDVGMLLKTKDGWKGRYGYAKNPRYKDVFGFSAMPGGCRFPKCKFGNVGFIGYWWTATDKDSDNAHVRYMNDDGCDPVLQEPAEKNCGFSVRCVRDE